MTAVVHFSGATDEGNKRDHNEDAYFADEDLGLWFVADGMGGHESGEVASAIVKDCVSQSVRDGVKLTDAINNAHHAVLDAGRKGIGSVGMGSTIVALQIKGNKYEAAWVGDSRAYLFDGELSQLSHDHSMVQELIDKGLLDKVEAKQHPHRHVITQSLGYVNLDDVKVGHITGQFLRNQKILLCSDGLNDEVSEEQISHIINTGDNEHTIVNNLIQTALGNGGSDNVTVLLITAPEDAPTEYTKSITDKFEPSKIKVSPREFIREHKELTYIALGTAMAVLLSMLMYYLY